MQPFETVERSGGAAAAGIAAGSSSNASPSAVAAATSAAAFSSREPPKSSLIRPSVEKGGQQQLLRQGGDVAASSRSYADQSKLANTSLQHAADSTVVMTKAQILSEARKAGGQSVTSSSHNPHANLGRSPSPDRSPQRASSPTRETTMVGNVHHAPTSHLPTTQQPLVPRSSAVQKLLVPLHSRNANGGGVEAVEGATAPPTKSGVIVDMQLRHQQQRHTAAAGQPQQTVVDDATTGLLWHSVRPSAALLLPEIDALYDEGAVVSAATSPVVRAVDYLTACDDIKQIAREREESFPRCADVPAEVRITIDLLQKIKNISSSDAQTSPSHHHHSDDDGIAFVSCHVGRVLVSHTAPSAVRCVIPTEERMAITQQYFTINSGKKGGRGGHVDAAASSWSSGGDAPFWIEESGEFVVHVPSLQVALVRSLLAGSIPAVRFQLPFYVEDVASIVIDEDTRQPSTRKSPRYHVDILIGGAPSTAGVNTSTTTAELPPSSTNAVRAMRVGPTSLRQTVAVTKKSSTTTTNNNNNNNAHDAHSAQDHSHHQSNDTTSSQLEAAPSEQLSAEGLPTIPIHSFRPLPELLSPSYVGATYLLTQPLSYLRSASELAERRVMRKDLLVRRSDAPHTTASPLESPPMIGTVVLSQEEAQSAASILLTKLEEATTNGQPVQEVLFQLIPLLTQIGGEEAIERATSLARLRVQVQCRALGLSEKALVSPAEELPLALLAGGVIAHGTAAPASDDRSGARSPTSQLRFVASLLLDQLRVSEHLLQYVIECAHLHKHVGKYRGALRWYRVGLLVANLLRGQDAHRQAQSHASSSSSPPPPPRGRGGQHKASNVPSMVPNDETGLLPFLKAIGDVSLTMGNTEEAIDAYEMGRAFAEMKTRISLGATAFAADDDNGAGGSPDALVQVHATRTLEFDAALAVAATLGNVVESAQAAMHRCEKTLEESASYRRLVALVTTLTGRGEDDANDEGDHGEGNAADILETLTLDDLEAAVEQCETAVEVFTQMGYCCLARDSTTQAKKYLERAMDLVELGDALQAKIPPQPAGGASVATESLKAFRGDVQVLRGWSYLRRAILAAGIHPLDPASNAPHPSSIANHEDEDNDEPVGAAAEVAAAHFLSCASKCFASALRAYQTLTCPADASSLTTTVTWLNSTCCEESLARTQSIANNEVAHQFSCEHPLANCIRITLCLLRADHWKQHGAICDNDDASEGREVELPVAVTVAGLLRPVRDFAHLCGVSSHDGAAAQQQQQLPAQHVTSLVPAAKVLGGRVVALASPPSSSSPPSSVFAAHTLPPILVSLCPRHPLLYVLWEVSAVACALTDSAEEACECLDLAAGVLVDGGRRGLGRHGGANKTAAPARRAASPVVVGGGGAAAPPPALQGREDAASMMATLEDHVLQQSAAATERLLSFIRRDDVLLCRRMTPLTAFCFSIASHRRHQQRQQKHHWHDGSNVTPLPIQRVEDLIAECVKELGLDGVHANTGASLRSVGSPSTRRVPRIVPFELPGIFLDIAEVRLCQEDSVGCLESCSRAIRLSDERNLLYLLGPLFKPAFQLSTSDVEDRARLLKERQVITYNTAASVSTFSASALSMVVAPASRSSMTTLALTLFTLARVHEAHHNYAQALLAFHQCYASLEMIGLASEPVAAEAFVGCSRSSLHLGNIGDGVMYADLALELFRVHHAEFGAYQTVPLLVELKNTMDHCRRTAECMMNDRHYTLAPHERRYTAPSLNGFPLYM